MTTVERESTWPRESTLPFTHVVLGRRISRGVLLVVVGALWIFEVSYVIGTVRPFLEPDGPGDAVLAYLTAISEGDATTANALVDPGVDEASAMLLTDEALLGAVARPSAIVVDPEFGSTYEDHEFETVTVAASYEMAGERTRVEVDVERSPDDAGTVAWRLVEPLVGEIEIQTYRTRPVTVAGITVPLEVDVDGQGVADLPAYPGVYRVAGPDSDYASAVPVDVEVAGDPDATSTATLMEEAATALPAELDRLLEEIAEKCRAGTWSRAADCAALLTYDPAVIVGFEAPRVASASAGMFWATDGSVSVAIPDDPEGPFTHEVSVSGTYEVRDGTLIITGLTW